MIIHSGISPAVYQVTLNVLEVDGELFRSIFLQAVVGLATGFTVIVDGAQEQHPRYVVSSLHEVLFQELQHFEVAGIDEAEGLRQFLTLGKGTSVK